jgi:hypothetical protein
MLFLFQFIYLNFRRDDVKAISTVDKTGKKKKHFPADASTNASKPSIIHSCWSCNKPVQSLLKCSLCGEPCQWEDWGRHKEWCRRRGETRKLKEKRNQRKTIDPLAETKTFEDDEVD